ncbi:MAG: hypothetical protein GQ570_12300 [Helicobacteraceae bacterium]|nr:hypothetical protein [Helicobacteraceae bacterium]
MNILELFLLFLLFFTTYYVYYILKEKYETKKSIEELKHKEFPTDYLKIIEHIPHYKLLNDEDKKHLHYLILRFLHFKKFSGVEVSVTDEMRVSIAFYACFMTLHMKDEYYDRLNEVVIYPHHLVVDNIRHFNQHSNLILEGINTGSTIVIAWNDAKRQIYHLSHSNVIVHEFAHELDFADGLFDGMPLLENAKYHSFAAVMFRRFELLNSTYQQGRYIGKYKLIGEYASLNEAEFFAVVSELYFERAKHLQNKFPDIYNALNSFYKLDMAEYN